MSATIQPRVTHVDIVNDDDGITVWPYWGGVDRPQGTGYGCPNAKVAARMKRAIEAGAVFTNPQVRTDINGKTYVSATSTILARKMNADLKRLGF